MNRQSMAPFSRQRSAALRMGSAIAAAAALLALPAAAAVSDYDWAATWQASPEPPRPPEVTLSGQTIREVAHISLGGDQVRVRLSNDYGAAPLTIGAAHVAISTVGAGIAQGSDRALTFNGHPSVTIPPYAHVISDPADLKVAALSNLAVSLYVPGSSGSATEHYFALQSAYIAARDVTGAPDLPGAAIVSKRAFLTGIDVSARRARVIVTLGDSITDGFGSSIGANRRWPDRLAERLNAKRGSTPAAVVNAGIGGNRLLHDVFGPNAVSRLDRDVLSLPKVTHLVVMLGINDFGFPGGRNLPAEEVSADDVITAYRQIISRAHAHGIKVIGATLLPFGPIPERPGFYSPASEAKRQAVNQWIRTSRAFDGVIDFEAAVRDPKATTRMLPAYDSGDHLDPNDAGYKAMADAIDLRVFD